MDNIKCNKCDQENKKDEHYCIKCGNNLSNLIEKTDVFFFFSNLLKVIGILDLLIFVPGLYLIEGILSMDGGNPSKPSVYCLILGISMIVIGILINKYTKKLCKNNINKN